MSSGVYGIEAKPARNQHFATAKLVNIYSPNHLEFLELFENSEPVSRDGRINRTFLEYGTEKLLESGKLMPPRVILSTSMPGRHNWLPAFYEDDSTIVDVTGTGNTFLGSLIFAMPACIHDVFEASAMASVAASFSLQQIGMPILSRTPIISVINTVRSQISICSYSPATHSETRTPITTAPTAFNTMLGYQLNMKKVREREDIEDGYIYLERVPYKPKKSGTGIKTSAVKSSPTPPAPSPKILPNPTANKPNEQTKPVANTNHGRPQQMCLQMAFTSIRHRLTQLFTRQAVTHIFGMMHEVAVKVIKAGRAMCNARSSSADDAGNTIHGVPSPHKDVIPAVDRPSVTDTFSTSTLQLGSREEDGFVVLNTLPHDLHDEEDFIMVQDVGSAPINEDDGFVMVDAVPWAEPPPSSPIHMPGRTSVPLVVRSLLF
ncbi:hypothetical protein KVR01_006557 [Diaporthe batatas]|uniref:uncharacterized protein n=1 Tax=Diaporthe batatas TaxID=748121 RepID=UPI001D0426C4|nr:uncharacterized protein KVR01_006557 [Diaporthe batatas]KAG8163260.1 hypothetical protein KVR01_006557 [Diaporthe batatas]